MQRNHDFSGSEHTLQAMRATRQIVKNRPGTLTKEAAYDDRGQYASWTLPGSFSEGSGCLPSLSWARLGRTWAAFGQFLEALGRLLDTGGWRAPVAIFAMVFGHAFRVSPLILYNA